MRKMKFPVFAALSFLFLILVYACKEKKPGDEATSEAVKTTTGVIDKNISATIKDSIVTLNGEVMDEATRTAAIKAVKHIQGVKTIRSYLTVKPGTPQPPKTVPGDSSETDSL